MSNLVICISDFDKFKNDFTNKALINNLVNSSKKVHLFHAFEKTFYNNEFSPFSWPDQKDFPEIEKKVTDKLKECGKELGIKADALVVSANICENANEEILHYLKDVKADTCVVATRKVGSLSEVFQSSTTDFLVRYASCNTVVLK